MYDEHKSLCYVKNLPAMAPTTKNRNKKMNYQTNLTK